jgi:N-formylglutamate amidohydrolase
MERDLPHAAYDIDYPDNWPDNCTSPFVFASPHSGREYSAAFLKESVLDAKLIRSSEDAFVDQLFARAPVFGAALLRAKAPRAFVDFNRSREELDPAVIKGLRPNGHNPRVAAGLGVIPRVVAQGRAIYRGKLTRSEAEARIRNYWQPYHSALGALLDQVRCAQGHVVLIDCHSMPREALEAVTKSGPLPEIVLGDRFGAAAGRQFVDALEAALAGQGFRVARNVPFAGAYITQAYGRPERSQHAIQIEIDRSLYMDEARIEPHSGFADIQARLTEVIAQLSGDQRLRPLAAE